MPGLDTTDIKLHVSIARFTAGLTRYQRNDYCNIMQLIHQKHTSDIELLKKKLHALSVNYREC